MGLGIRRRSESPCLGGLDVTFELVLKMPCRKIPGREREQSFGAERRGRGMTSRCVTGEFQTLYYPGLTGVWGTVGQGQGQSQVLDGQAKPFTLHALKKN